MRVTYRKQARAALCVLKGALSFPIKQFHIKIFFKELAYIYYDKSF